MKKTKSLSSSVIQEALEIANIYHQSKGFVGYAFSKCKKGIEVSLGKFLYSSDISNGSLMTEDWDGFICFKNQQLVDLHSGEQIAL
jgi:hypothetical protein